MSHERWLVEWGAYSRRNGLLACVEASSESGAYMAACVLLTPEQHKEAAALGQIVSTRASQWHHYQPGCVYRFEYTSQNWERIVKETTS